MLVSIKGKYQNGVVRPDEPIADREGQKVIITFVEEETEAISSDSSNEEEKTEPIRSDDLEAAREAGWDQLMALIERNTIDTGIEDLAYQHDHYIHGQPKQD